MSSEDNEWSDRPDHPLLKYPIMSAVFKHLKRKDLKECRLVCKTWNVFTIPFTRKVFSRITIHGTDTTEKHTLKNFVQVFRSNKLLIPFGRYRLGPFCTTYGVGREFLELYGDTINKIEFMDWEEYKVEYISELLKSTPKLEFFHIPKHLHSRSGNIVMLFPHGAENSKPRLRCLKEIYISEDNSEERNKFCPTFLEELITAGENISSFSLHEPYKRYGSEGDICTTIVEVLSLIEKLGRESSILKLNISHEQTPHSESFELLRAMTAKPRGLGLKELRYYTLHSGQDNYQLQSASLMKDTLLKLRITQKSWTTFREFPKFPKLRSLSVYLPEKDFNSRFTNLKDIFPALEKLKLQESQSGIEHIDFFPESEPCATMKSLQIDVYSIRINAFCQIQTVFPNLIRLEIVIGVDGVEILRRIFSHMTQLKSLEIRDLCDMQINSMDSDSMDSILTGIPTHTLGNIKRTVNKLKNTESEVQRKETILKLRNEHSQFPSIANLTNLRDFFIFVNGKEDGNRNGRMYLTDLTAFLGIYSLPRLKNLGIHQCKMSKTCCEILKKDMGLEMWMFEAPGRHPYIIPPHPDWYQ